MSREDVLNLFKKELREAGFLDAKNFEIEKAIRLAIKNDYVGNSMAMTIYGLLDGKLSNLKDSCEKIFS